MILFLQREWITQRFSLAYVILIEALFTKEVMTEIYRKIGLSELNLLVRLGSVPNKGMEGSIYGNVEKK